MKFKKWLLEETTNVQLGQTFEIPDNKGDLVTVKVMKIRGDKVWLLPSYYPETPSLGGAIIMPLLSVSHFVNDLNKQVKLNKRSGDVAIDAVLDGKAEYLGKGDDGLVFAVGDEVVKVSTTVPYHPGNHINRYPSEAARMTFNEYKASQTLLKLGVPGILPSRFKIVGDKAFMVRPKVELLQKPTPPQLKEVRSIIKGMHKVGWTCNDEIQVGSYQGKVYLYDLGKAGKNLDKHTAESDNFHLELLYSRSGHGELFAPVGNKLQEYWDSFIDPDGFVTWIQDDEPEIKEFLAKIKALYPYMLEEFPEIRKKTESEYETIMKVLPTS